MYYYFMEQLIYQMFILGTGDALDSALAKGLGGVIFFTKDIQTKEQFKNLIKDIKSKAMIPPFLSIKVFVEPIIIKYFLSIKYLI